MRCYCAPAGSSGDSPSHRHGPDRPVWFVAVVAAVTGPLVLVHDALDPLARALPGVIRLEDLRSVLENNGLPLTIAYALVLLLVIGPVAAMVGLYIISALTHVLISLLVPNNDHYEVTLKVTAYSNALNFLSWVPVAGYVTTLYVLYVNYWGYREMHGATRARALAVVAVQALFLLGVFTANLLWATSGASR